jgi:hypothetical protein
VLTLEFSSRRVQGPPSSSSLVLFLDAEIHIQILIATLLSAFTFELAEGVDLDFYHLGGNTVKPKARHHENEGVQLPLKVSSLTYKHAL